MYKSIFDLRMVVGYLGEKSQNAWWDSSFLTPASKSFLSPVFSKTTILAQYHGVCQAASLVHDEFIGLGIHYHLYRLPDSLERMLAKALQDKDLISVISKTIADKDSVKDRLRGHCGSIGDLAEGPIAVGDFSDNALGDLFTKSLTHYWNAFENNCKCFPYMRYS